MKNFIQVKIGVSEPDLKEMFIAELSENDFYAFQEEENFLFAYINEIDFDETKLKSILENTFYTVNIIEEENWNEDWEKNFQPILVENFAGIRASFHKPLKNVLHEIIITPKMSFGTGHHATTFLMIQMMEVINFSNKKVFDFGTGTGVLAILAEKLGALSILGLDNDDWSIKNALENVEANKCKRVFIKKEDNIKDVSCVDIILANINFNVLTENASALSGLLKSASLLLISGILLTDEKVIVKTFEAHCFVKIQLMHKDGWLAILFKKL